MDDPKKIKDDKKEKQVKQELTDDDVEGVDGGVSKNMKVIGAVLSDNALDNTFNKH